MLTEPELLVRARDWSEALYGIVPMEALNASMKRAFETHNSTFPLNAYDIKIAYTYLKTHSMELDEARPLTTDERVERCPNKANHLPDRFGEIEYYVPGKIDAIVPCGACRVEEFHAEKARLLAA